MKKYIESKPEVLGGTPVIKGTRIPVSQIIYLLKDGYTIEAIQLDYPHVELKTLKGAIDEAIEIVNSQGNASPLS